MGKNIALVSGWLLAIVLGGILYVEMQTVRALNEKLETAQATYESVKDSAARMIALEEKARLLEETVARLTNATAGAAEKAKSLSDAVRVPEDFDPSGLVERMLGGNGKTTESAQSEEGKPANPFAEMFEGEQGQQLMESALPMQVNMQYSALFEQLNLPDDRKAALREVLLEHARAGADAGMAMLRGEQGPEDIQAPSDEDLMAAVSELLTPEELEQFAEYQENLPEMMMRQQFDMQFGMMAGDVPEEIRSYTVDVLVENLLAAQPEQTGGQPDFDAMRVAFDNTLVQLEAELSPEDVARVRPLIEQQRAGIDMAARMFGGEVANDTEGVAEVP